VSWTIHLRLVPVLPVVELLFVLRIVGRCRCLCRCRRLCGMYNFTTNPSCGWDVNKTEVPCWEIASLSARYRTQCNNSFWALCSWWVVNKRPVINCTGISIHHLWRRHFLCFTNSTKVNVVEKWFWVSWSNGRIFLHFYRVVVQRRVGIWHRRPLRAVCRVEQIELVKYRSAVSRDDVCLYQCNLYRSLMDHSSWA
jgi:hypothetical protein